MNQRKTVRRKSHWSDSDGVKLDVEAISDLSNKHCDGLGIFVIEGIVGWCGLKNECLRHQAKR